MNIKTILITAAVVAGLGIVGSRYLGNTGMDDMPGMNHSNGTTDASPATAAFKISMDAMMKGMMVAPTGKPDLDFMQGMIPHHQGAIDMAKVVLQHGKNAEVKAFAENVVKAQAAEIAFMNAWLAKTDMNALPTSADASKGNAAAMATMMKDMMVPYTGDADVDFIKGMIPHHQGAIDAAKVALQFAQDPDVLKLAQDINSAQQGEITFMQDWLKKQGK